MRMPGIGIASPSKSRSTPAMMGISEDFPEPFWPKRPILAPGKKMSEMSLRICRLGGTILPTRLREYTYCAMNENTEKSLLGAFAGARSECAAVVRIAADIAAVGTLFDGGRT